MSSETAMSPAKPLPKAGGGNDSTSVAWFLPRNREFNDLISRLSVTMTVTAPFSFAARHACATNAVNARRLNPRIGRLITMVGSAFKVPSLKK
jgi:hypothetical protein